MDTNLTAAPRNDSFDVLTINNPSDTEFPVYYNSELHAIIQPGKAIQLVKLIAGDSDHGAVKHLVDRMCRLSGKPKNDPNSRSEWISKVVISQTVSHLPTTPTLVDQARIVNEQLAQTPLDIPAPSMPQVATPTPSFPVQPTTPVSPNWKFDPLTGRPLQQSKPVIITPDQVDVSHVELQTSALPLSIPQPGGASAPVLPPPHPNPEANELLGGIRKTDGDEGEKVIGEVPANDTPAPELAPTRPLNPNKDDLIAYARDVLMMDINEAGTKLQLETQSVDQLKDTLKYDPYA